MKQRSKIERCFKSVTLKQRLTYNMEIKQAVKISFLEYGEQQQHSKTSNGNAISREVKKIDINIIG